MSWVKIEDRNVRHIWANPDGTGEIEISPDWYADNGTPVCGFDSDFDGEDMIYVRTEILANEEDNTGQAIFYTGEYPNGMTEGDEESWEELRYWVDLTNRIDELRRERGVD